MLQWRALASSRGQFPHHRVLMRLALLVVNNLLCDSPACMGKPTCCHGQERNLVVSTAAFDKVTAGYMTCHEPPEKKAAKTVHDDANKLVPLYIYIYIYVVSNHSCCCLARPSLPPLTTPQVQHLCPCSWHLPLRVWQPAGCCKPSSSPLWATQWASCRPSAPPSTQPVSGSAASTLHTIWV